MPDADTIMTIPVSAAVAAVADDKASRKNPALQQQHKTQLTAQAVGEMYGYKSNVFRMETEEMLAEVALNYGSKRMGAVDKLLHQIKSVVFQIIVAHVLPHDLRKAD